MANPVLVRGGWTTWHTAGWVLGGLGVVAGIVLVVFGQLWGIIPALAGIALLVVSAVATLISHLSRMWVDDLGASFVVTDRQGSKELRDDEVVALTHSTQRQQSGGEISGLVRTFKVWVDSSPEPVTMINTIKSGHFDPLQGLVDRLVDGLAARMNEAIERGGSAAGEGWRIDRNYLTIGAPGHEEPVPLSAITAVDMFEGKMCVWREGRDDAMVKIPLGARNTHLLPILLSTRMPNPEERKPSASATGLGRILFERKPAAAFAWLLFGGSIVAVIVGMVLLVNNGANMEGVMGLLISLAIGLLCAVGGVALRFMLFRCHEGGVYKANLLGEKTLPYKDVASFTYGATRHYHNGVYTGTALSMRFDPYQGSGAPAISYTANVQVADDDLDELRDFISRTLAIRMADQLSTGQPVPWTSNLVFLREGIQFRPAGWVGRKEPQFLPWETYGGYNLNQGVFYLFARDNKNAVVNEQCSAANFFPGFYLLLMMTQKQEGSE